MFKGHEVSLEFRDDGMLGQFSGAVLPVTHGFSTIKAGPTFLPDDPFSAEAEANKERFLQNFCGAETENFVKISPKHSNTVCIVGKEDRGEAIECDGLITTSRFLPLILRPADCFPIILSGHTCRNGEWFVGLVHAGFAGTMSQVISKAIQLARDKLGAGPADMMVAIGPGIHSCCYYIYGDRYNRFSRDPNLKPFITEGRYPGLDLLRMNIRQILDEGVPLQNIVVANTCTYCARDLLGEHIFYSRLRAKETGEQDARFMTVVVL